MPDVLRGLASQYGEAPATLACAWLLRHPARPRPVTGSGRIQALREAMAVTMLQLSAEARYRVCQASTGHEVP